MAFAPIQALPTRGQIAIGPYMGMGKIPIALDQK